MKQPANKDELRMALKVYEIAFAEELRVAIAAGHPTSSPGLLAKIHDDILGLRSELDNLEYEEAMEEAA